MALRFSKKKPQGSDHPGDAGKDEAFSPDPETARGWFEHGRKAADPDYALTCFANGIKLDPATMSAHEAMFEASLKYAAAGGKPAAGKEQQSMAVAEV